MFNKTEIVTNVTRSLNKFGLLAKKHSPEILLVTGIASGIGATVLACKATLKVNEVKEKTQKNILKINEATEAGITEAGEPYNEEDHKKDLTLVYVQTGFELAKLYAPAVGLGVLSVTSILAGHNIMRKRNVALAAAYTIVDNNFKEYRGRVVERFGKELDKELRYNIKAVEVEEKVVNEDGKEETVKKTIDVVDMNSPESYTDYAKFFDAASPFWDKNAEYNLLFLKRQEEQATRTLRERGYLMLNDVYEMLGIMKTEAGAYVGWVYDKNRTDEENQVSFCIYELNREANRAFVNGYEPVILLDFNVDGYIMNKIGFNARI
jgi:hypothetical protein